MLNKNTVTFISRQLSFCMAHFLSFFWYANNTKHTIITIEFNISTLGA